MFLCGESQGQRNLAGYSPWGLQEQDTTEPLTLLLLQSGRTSSQLDYVCNDHISKDHHHVCRFPVELDLGRMPCDTALSEQPGNTEPLYPSGVKPGMFTAPSSPQERLSFPEAGAPLLEHNHGARRCQLALCGAQNLGNWPTTMLTLGSRCCHEL